MDLNSHPLTQGLNQAGALDSYLNLPVCDPSRGGWIAATHLFGNNRAGLREMVMKYGYESWGTTNNHVAASAFLVAYLARVIYPVVGQYVLRRRVPRATLANLAFHRRRGRIDATALRQPQFAVLPNDPAAGHPDAEVLDNEHDLYLRFKEWVFAANLDLVIEALHRSVPASLKVSQNSVAAACALAFHRLFSLVEDKDAVVNDADVFFRDSSSPLFGQVSMEVIEHQGKAGLFGRRAGCCLIWRTGESDGYCSNCVLRPKDEQNQRFREMLEGAG